MRRLFQPWGYKQIPTVDIYFRTPLKRLITKGNHSTPETPIRRLGPYSFYVNNQVVIIRYLTPAELKTIHRLKPDRCIYVIDDSLSVLDGSSFLPSGYQEKLKRFKANMLPSILALVDTVVTSNPLLHTDYLDKQCLLLDPAYIQINSDYRHFEKTDRIKILFSGTGSHQHDLEMLAELLADICKRRPEVQLTTFMGKQAPASLKRKINIQNRRQLSWPSYMRFMKNERFHIALAPYRDTAFNRARSYNKILDHAAFGAAGFYSARPPISKKIDHDCTGLLIGDDPRQWTEAIEELASKPEQMRKLAEGGAALARKLGNPQRVRQFWFDLLKIGAEEAHIWESG